MTREVKAWWEETAEYFQSEIDMDVGVNWVGFGPELNLLEPVDGKAALELGCGGGQCSVALAERGADVTGIDLSAEQLAHAQKLADERGVDISLIEGDLTDLPVADESVDVAFNTWVFQWVEDLDACFAEAHRILRPGGRFVFSTPHPFYEIVDSETHEVSESYFDTGQYVVHQQETEHDQPLVRHRVSDIYNALADVGFDVRELREPGTDNPKDYEEGPWGIHTPELMSKVPVVLVVDARKDG